ncbi:Prolactin regulatory element-binding protein [Aix galericulata]|nr:Prolactin regulatory element-binding protein [Aix galericulata]
MSPRRAAELYRAPFPLYTVRLHPRRPLAITAGGGGAAKTGIRNGVHFLQLEQVGGQLSASLLHSHDTETRATMTMALADDFIAAGQDADCHILRFSLQPPPGRGAAGRDAGGEKGPRKRKGPSPAAQGETQNQTSEVTVESLHSVRTDFSPDALQKAVRFNADCSLLVTGGADGFLRLWEVGTGRGTRARHCCAAAPCGRQGSLCPWAALCSQFPSMKKTLEFKAHDGEIEDIALGPDNKVVTAGRDFQCCVWQRDQLVTGLCWNENLPGIPDKAYRYQACRFGEGTALDPHSAPALPLGSAVAVLNAGTAPTLPSRLRGAAVPARGQRVLSRGRFGAVEDNAGALRLYTVQVPHKRERRPPPCYLTKWDGRSFLPLLTRPCGSEVRRGAGCGHGAAPAPLTATPPLRSDSGTFLGLGTVTGSVAIHIAFSLQRLYYVKEAHGIVVTDVAFVPESQRGRELLAGNEAALLSVAVDSRCKLHLLPGRRSLPVWLLLLLCAGLIVATILLLQLAFPGFL